MPSRSPLLTKLAATHSAWLLAGSALLVFATSSQAEVQVATGYSPAGSGFAFKSVPPPANNDAATNAKFTLVDGTRDGNGGDLAVLHDGRVPTGEDQPAANFFFRAGTDGGRIQIDLGGATSVKAVASYSWHAGTRGPQVYKLYAADGAAPGFQPEPKKGTDPASCGWKLIAGVDTRPKDGPGAGQHGAAITDTAGTIGKYRYLLFDIARTEDRDAFGNTFYSEIDVIDANGPAPIAAVDKPVLQTFASADGRIHYTIDLTGAPDLTEWSAKALRPVVEEWYPKIVALLPSDGYEATNNITLRYRTDMGKIPATADPAGVNLNAPWFRGELQREARGAVVHELVHVVQRYWQVRRGSSPAKPNPGWLVEGIADYVRWFLYEPQTKGAEITAGNIAKANYDSSYRITANFLNWATQTYDKDLVRKLNAAAREGRYDETLWKEWTGKTVQELGAEWKKFNEQRISSAK